MELSPPELPLELAAPELCPAPPCICAWQVTANASNKTRAGPADKACIGPPFGFLPGIMQFYRGKDSNLAKDIGFATEEYRCKSRPGGLNLSATDLRLLLPERGVGAGNVGRIERPAAPDARLVRVGEKDIHDRTSFVLRRAIHKARHILFAAAPRGQHQRVIKIGVQPALRQR